MKRQKENPAADGVIAAGRAFEITELERVGNPKISPAAVESPAVVIFAQRLGLTITHARIVCHLAGIGGRAE